MGLERAQLSAKQEWPPGPRGAPPVTPSTPTQEQGSPGGHAEGCHPRSPWWAPMLTTAWHFLLPGPVKEGAPGWSWVCCLGGKRERVVRREQDYVPGQRGGGANTHEHRPWSALCLQSLRTGLGEATSFPTRLIDESFRGCTKVTVLGQDLIWVYLTPSLCPFPQGQLTTSPRVYTLRARGPFLRFSSMEGPRFWPQ